MATIEPAQDTVPDEPEERARLQLDFSPEAYARLAKIRKQAQAPSNAEVVRDALRLYEWFLEQKREQYRLQLVKDDIVQTPKWEHLLLPKSLPLPAW